MKFSFVRQMPVVITAAVVGVVCLVDWLPRWSSFEGLNAPRRLEWITYDWRMRLASGAGQTTASNLAFVAITDASISAVLDGEFGYQHGLYWPRHVYGRALRELTAQGARAVAFDILFDTLRPDHAKLAQPGGGEITSDGYFADELAASGRAVLAADREAVPAELFATNAWAIGDVSQEKDADGISRRARAFVEYPVWHPEIKQLARALDLNLRSAAFEKARIVFQQRGTAGDDGEPGKFELPLNADGMANLEEITGEPGKSKIPPLVRERLWSLGTRLAARELGLDLDHAEVDLAGGRITLRGSNGVERVLPVDADGRFLIDWSLRPGDPRMISWDMKRVLSQDLLRQAGRTNTLADEFRDRLVVIGSEAKGNDLTDFGATPLDKETYLVSRYWNVANAIIMNRFIRPLPFVAELFLIAAFGALAAVITWRQQRLAWASLWIAAAGVAYVALAAWLFVDRRLWLPIVMPAGGGLLLTHGALVTYRAVFEQQERRRVRSVFAKVVSPEVVTELLQAESVKLGGARRSVSVFFADVRGFTEFTDQRQEIALEYVRQKNLAGRAAEEYFDQQAQDTLRTVSLYLGVVADTVKRHGGTLDKYIGDCVMAFWGAPTPNDRHALMSVRAGVEAQRAIDALNRERAAENARREQARATGAADDLAPLPLLTLGTGINTGLVTVGLMGSDAHILNYTVFGREVNLASRLEGVSGHSRVIISEATYAELLKHDAALAGTCLPQAAITVRGIRSAINIFEVPWR